MFQGRDPDDLWERGHTKLPLIFQSGEGCRGGCLEEFAILSLKHANPWIHGCFFLLLFVVNTDAGSFWRAEVLSQFDLYQLDTLSLSSPSLIFCLYNHLVTLYRYINTSLSLCLFSLQMHAKIKKSPGSYCFIPLAHWSISVFSVQSTAGLHEGWGISLQKCLARYLISWGFIWMRRQRCTIRRSISRGPKGTATTNTTSGLCQSVRSVPTWKKEVKKKRFALPSCSNVGCQKDRKSDSLKFSTGPLFWTAEQLKHKLHKEVLIVLFQAVKAL